MRNGPAHPAISHDPGIEDLVLDRHLGQEGGRTPPGRSLAEPDRAASPRGWSNDAAPTPRPCRAGDPLDSARPEPVRRSRRSSRGRRRCSPRRRTAGPLRAPGGTRLDRRTTHRCLSPDSAVHCRDRRADPQPHRRHSRSSNPRSAWLGPGPQALCEGDLERLTHGLDHETLPRQNAEEVFVDVDLKTHRPTQFVAHRGR